MIRSDEREDSRMQAMRYVLSLVDYRDKSLDLQPADANKVFL